MHMLYFITITFKWQEIIKHNCLDDRPALININRNQQICISIFYSIAVTNWMKGS